MITRNEILSAAHSADRYANVRNLMKTNVQTISPDADRSADGYRALQESGLRALPVVEGTQLVGMLTLEGVGQASFCATSTASSSKVSGSWP
ncbi:MAG TPA: CBS domain-containing protein [Rubrobacteraceae bacterium]|nr:CBS domain-containing protein [Rubrobacteraceae bacterium]